MYDRIAGEWTPLSEIPTLKNKINSKYIIYKIDTNNLNIKLYKDPNYNNGYYSINNIPATNISVFDKEV